MLVLVYRIFFFHIPNGEKQKPVEKDKSVETTSSPIPISLVETKQRKIKKKLRRKKRSSPSAICVGLSPAFKSMELFDLDLKNDQIYFSTLMKLFDNVEENTLNYMKKIDQGFKEDGVLCAPLREEISNIEYMLSIRDGRDPKVRNIVLVKYTSIAYALLDNKRSYFPLTQAVGLFMNIAEMNFFTGEQEKELSYIYNRIHDDYKAFKHTSKQSDGIDKNGDADIILLLDWIGSLDN